MYTICLTTTAQFDDFNKVVEGDDNVLLPLPSMCEIKVYLNPILTWMIWFWYITKPKFASEVPKREMANHAL